MKTKEEVCKLIIKYNGLCHSAEEPFCRNGICPYWGEKASDDCELCPSSNGILLSAKKALQRIKLEKIKEILND